MVNFDITKPFFKRHDLGLDVNDHVIFIDMLSFTKEKPIYKTLLLLKTKFTSLFQVNTTFRIKVALKERVDW